VSRVLVNPNCRYFKAFSRDSKGILGEDKEKNNKILTERKRKGGKKMKISLEFEEKEVSQREGFARINDIWFNPDTLEVYQVINDDETYDEIFEEGEELIEFLQNIDGEIDCGDNERLWRAIAELGFGDRAVINGMIRSIGY